MSRIRTVLICSAISIALSLALARVHAFGDAGLYTVKTAEPLIPINAQISPEARAILISKCADCHSNQSRAPFYGHFTPVSWLMERDIIDGRRAMNLSLWESYSPDQKQTLAAKIVHLAKTNEMPPLQYRMIHRNTRVTDAEVAALSAWARGVQGLQAGGVAGAGDPEKGKLLFEKRCTGCHSLTQNHQGPQLQGVFGRVSGTAPGYAYSAALKKAHIAWDAASLDKWLTDPDAFIPGNNMDFLVAKSQDRQDIISYLKQASGK